MVAVVLAAGTPFWSGAGLWGDPERDTQRSAQALSDPTPHFSVPFRLALTAGALAGASSEPRVARAPMTGGPERTGAPRQPAGVSPPAAMPSLVALRSVRRPDRISTPPPPGFLPDPVVRPHQAPERPRYRLPDPLSVPSLAPGRGDSRRAALEVPQAWGLALLGDAGVERAAIDVIAVVAGPVPQPSPRPNATKPAKPKTAKPGPGAVEIAPMPVTRPPALAAIAARDLQGAKSRRSARAKRPSLLGILDLAGGRRGLLRLGDGSIESVARGDRIAGWRVGRIGETSLHVSRGGKSYRLALLR